MSTKLYFDVNSWGIAYVVDEQIADKFVEHVNGEGACVVYMDPEETYIPDDWDICAVHDVREDEEYWGLVCEYLTVDRRADAKAEEADSRLFMRECQYDALRA